MYLRLYIFLLTIATLTSCNSSRNGNINSSKEYILKIEMNLSAFGVESDDFPSIDAYVDFRNDSSNCNKSYYNPAYKGSIYYLSKNEIKNVLTLLERFDLEKLKKEYSVGSTDQPTSTTTIYTSTKKIIIKDYGLKGDYPLPELYKLVYKL
jgi:hypothetical protein